VGEDRQPFTGPAFTGPAFTGSGRQRQAAAAEALGVAVAARVPVLLWGAPGTGKTSAIRAAEFLAWLTEMDLPDPEAVLADPGSFVLPSRSDRAYAAVTAVAAVVAADPAPDRWAAGWQVLGIAARSAPDVAAVAARVLVRCRPDGTALPAEVRLFGPVLRDAGLLRG